MFVRNWHMHYDNLWRSEIYNNVSAKDRVQDIIFIQFKLKMKDTYKKGKITTKFEPNNNEDVVNKA